MALAVFGCVDIDQCPNVRAGCCFHARANPPFSLSFAGEGPSYWLATSSSLLSSWWGFLGPIYFCSILVSLLCSKLATRLPPKMKSTRWNSPG
jgi:hypothetical protein